MEALLALTLFGSVVWFWVAVLLFVIICFISDVAENGVPAFVTLIIIGLAIHFWGDAKVILAAFSFASVFGYLLLGLLFSVFRTFFAGRKLGKEMKDESDSHKVSMKKSFLYNMQGNVFRWWFMWPISLLSWVATDFIVDAWEYIYSKVGKLYNYVLELGIKSIGLN